jgi:hypothetical protein
VSAGELRKRLADGANEQPEGGWVIQKYIHPPLLVEGRKFDYRCFAFIARTEPHLWYFVPGYCRLSMVQYSSDLNDRHAHLTNRHLNATHKDFQDYSQISWSREQVRDAVQGQPAVAEVDCLWSHLHDQIKRIMATIHDATKEHLPASGACYHLLGCDFLFDADLNAHLLEVNECPGLEPLPFDAYFHGKIMKNACETAIRCSKVPDSAPIVGNFELIVDERIGFRYGAETSAMLLGSPSPDAAGQKPRGLPSVENLEATMNGTSQ